METVARRVPFDKRKRTETSCDRCRLRKQKCHRIPNQDHCKHCETHSLPCLTTAPRKKRVYGSTETISSRIALLEGLVKGLLPEADLSSNAEMQQLGKSLGIPLPEAEDDALHDVEASANKTDDDAVQLLRDQQGQRQWIGPSSSFLFHLRLRKMIGDCPSPEFAMFGRNAANQAAAVSALQTNAGGAVHSGEAEHCSSPTEAIKQIGGRTLDILLDAYFDTVHPDFPVLHEASFRETYENWWQGGDPDSIWLCSLLCLLILSRRVADTDISEDTEEVWWHHVQSLLPTVIFSSTLSTVQALLLASLHLHNTNHRDACWNLTGIAVRVAYATGMHREDTKAIHSPLMRQLKKRLWWTLVAYEQMQVSSYDRPSAIATLPKSVGSPNERLVGLSGHFAPEMMASSIKLTGLLCKACEALQYNVANADESYGRPLSPMATILRDLGRWKTSLPKHLRLEAVDSLAASLQRALLLMHCQYLYILVVLGRTALMRKAASIILNPEAKHHAYLESASQTCIDAAVQLGKLLCRMDSIGKFNARTWFDTFLVTTTAMVIVLHIRIDNVKNRLAASQSHALLQEMAALMFRQARDPRVPGTMRTLARIVEEVNLTAKSFDCAPVSPQTTPMPANEAPPQLPRPDQQPLHSMNGSTLLDTGRENPAFTSGSHNASDGGSLPVPGVTFPAIDPDLVSYEDDAHLWAFWDELRFDGDGTMLDVTQDWSWDDIEAIVRGP